jgi:hypothetical protein
MGELMQVEETVEGELEVADLPSFSTARAERGAAKALMPQRSEATGGDFSGQDSAAYDPTPNKSRTRPASAEISTLQYPSAVKLQDRVRVLRGDFQGHTAVVTAPARVRNTVLSGIFEVEVENPQRSTVVMPVEFLQLVEHAADAPGAAVDSLTPRQQSEAEGPADTQGVTCDTAQSSDEAIKVLDPDRASMALTTAALRQDTVRLGDGTALQLQTHLEKAPKPEQFATGVASKPRPKDASPSIIVTRKGSIHGSHSGSDIGADNPMRSPVHGGAAGSSPEAPPHANLSPKLNGQPSSKFASITDLPHLPPPAAACDDESPAPASPQRDDEQPLASDEEKISMEAPAAPVVPAVAVAAQESEDIWGVEVSAAELEQASRWN